ncbi:sialate O-acetylesterase [Mucilaginibacter pocheonensis]|uniref:Sialate O-acetylesterase n=1 Tax=Mucilaginibacter pocheonensis TaxID=398050 RepID=A0ABU1T6M4_9SPHI|nr:sialate O-acetylesterase [Mucilaginibacter pocheonensis]MDR6941009.1 sialate O-acetylesterase [Mucilaginibacter pocheonensis]
MKSNIRILFIKALPVLIMVCARMISYADVRLPAVIGSNMVLQQQSQVKLWGWGEPYEKIVVTTSWDNKIYPEIRPDGNANWLLNITTPAAGGPYTITLKGHNTIVLTNIMIGEVWICSGQSNMEMSGNWGLQDIKEVLPVAGNSNIRFFHIPKATAHEPQNDCNAQWTVCDSNTLRSFSAVGYFFGKNLNSKLNVPVGLIEAAWSGSSAEVWTPDSVVNNDDVLKQAATKIAANGQCPNLPGYAYNGMIAPVKNFAIAGAIWYQGENNTINALTYPRLFTSMIDAWRKAWNKDIPFYFVQVAPFKYQLKNVGALMRESQTKSMKHSNTGMVVITDLVADTNNVHPANKYDVGLRLANWALAETYHLSDVVYKSPIFKNIIINKAKAIIQFDNADKGLTIRGTAIKELFIAGEDKIFYPADASVKKDEIVVWSPQVKQPVAVRYGFSNTAIGNLFGKNGLPVGPFRTDNWPVEVK